MEFTISLYDNNFRSEVSHTWYDKQLQLELDE